MWSSPNVGNRWAGVAAWTALAALGAGAAPWRNLATRGLPLVLVHVADLSAAAAIIVLSVGCGRGLLRRTPLVLARRLDVLLFSLGVGVGVLGAQILVLSALVGVGEWWIAGLLVANAVAAGRELSHIGLVAFDVWTRGRQRLRLSLSSAPLAVALLAAVVLLCLALAPPSDWDSLMYHLQLPAEWLRRGRISTVDGNEHAALVGLVHMLYLPLLAARSGAGAAVASAILTLGLAGTVFAIGRRFFGLTEGSLSLAMLWGTPTILLVGSTARVDVSLTLLLLLTHYALLIAWLDPPRRGYLELAGVLAGFAVGSKYHAGLYLLALGPLVVAAAHRGGARPLIRGVATFGLLACLAALPWLLKNTVLFGAPFYPYFAPQRLPTWLGLLLRNPAALGTLDPRVFQVQETARAEFNIHDAFLEPGRLGVGGETGFYFLNPVLVLVPFLLLAARDRELMALAGPAALYAVALVVPFPKTNMRYLLPAVAPLTLACTVLAVRASRALPPPVRRPLLGLLLVTCLAPTIVTASIWLTRTRAIGYLAGSTSGAEYLSTHFSPVVRSHERVTEAANRLLSGDDKVLMLWESRGYYLDARAIEDTRLANWPLVLAAIGEDRCLEGSGLTHVLARRGAAEYYERRGVGRGVMGLEAFGRFADRCLTVLYEEPGVTLYAAFPRQVPPPTR